MDSQGKNFQILLPNFKGPFDLLLFFIQRDELDIYDIPISKITSDFLDYIHSMKQLNIELASEFILVAATLIKIKTEMLLPRIVSEEEHSEIDPRSELVQKLIEYKQFKEFTEKLVLLESEKLKTIKRTSAEKEISNIANLFETDFEMENLTLAKLSKVFVKLLNKKQNDFNEDNYNIELQNYTIESEKDYILTQFDNKSDKISFENIFKNIDSLMHAVFRFLSILELIQESKILIFDIEGKINSFWLAKNLQYRDEN